MEPLFRTLMITYFNLKIIINPILNKEQNIFKTKTGQLYNIK